ncbi:MAG TPA: hypothetical protein VME40_15740 [Caulobacteraceae bacterium]|nr:hypothetical protein [Caulobacteraceae bacterium]
MRTGTVALALLVAAAAWSASAQPMADQARDDYQAELSRQCPDKQLQMLSARNLSDALDDYKQSLPADVQARFSEAETDQCSSIEDGAACVNNVDLATAEDVGRIGELAGAVCSDFLQCRGEGDCDYAR